MQKRGCKDCKNNLKIVSRFYLHICAFISKYVCTYGTKIIEKIRLSFLAWEHEKSWTERISEGLGEGKGRGK